MTKGYGGRGWAALAAVGAAIFAQPGSAAWLEASSDHFVVYSDTSEKQLREFASRLERFDKALRVVFMSTPLEDEGRRSNRLRIYVVTGVGTVQELCGRNCRNVLGFYSPRAGGSAAFTPRRSGNGSPADLDAQKVLFHEYAHHFMYANFTAAYPAWYSEGFAELASTAQFKKNGGLGFGLPAQHRAYGLFEGKRLTLEQLLDTSTRRLDPQSMDYLYGRGWLLTHYLYFTTARLGQLHTYIEAINKGTPSVAAGKEAFGDLKALDRELDQYLTKKMKYIPLAADRLTMGSIDIRPLDAGRAAMMPVHIRSTRGVTPQSALKLLPDARRLATPYPENPEVQVQLAEAEFDAGNEAEAEAAAGRALKADPKNMTALLYKGRISVSRAMAAHATDETVWKLARAWFVKANKVDPNAAQPLYLFYDSFIAQGVKPTANAVLGLSRAFELSPEDRGLRVRVAYQALQDAHPKLARAALAPVAFDPHASGIRDVAASAVALIDADQGAAAAEVLRTQPKDDEDEGGD